MRHTLALLIGLVTLSGTTAVAFAADPKLAYVDVQRVLDTIEEGKKAKAEFEKEMLAKKADLDKKQSEIKKMDDDFDKQKQVLSASALDAKRKELENKKLELQKSYMQIQSDTAKREEQLVGGIFKKIQQVVEKIGRDGGYDFVWEKREGGIIYGKNTLDLTEQVIAAYDKSNKK